MKILAIQTNIEGRPCGWGIADCSDADAKNIAKAEALRQYDAHCCYSGECRGEMLFHLIDGCEERAAQSK